MDAAAIFMTDGIRDILDRLRAPAGNVVARARRMVETHVPEERRGPGWDRHWRELEAYLELPGQWPCAEGKENDG